MIIIEQDLFTYDDLWTLFLKFNKMKRQAQDQEICFERNILSEDWDTEYTRTLKFGKKINSLILKYAKDLNRNLSNKVYNRPISTHRDAHYQLSLGN